MVLRKVWTDLPPQLSEEESEGLFDVLEKVMSGDILRLMKSFPSPIERSRSMTASADCVFMMSRRLRTLRPIASATSTIREKVAPSYLEAS